MYQCSSVTRILAYWYIHQLRKASKPRIKPSIAPEISSSSSDTSVKVHVRRLDECLGLKAIFVWIWFALVRTPGLKNEHGPSTQKFWVQWYQGWSSMIGTWMSSLSWWVGILVVFGMFDLFHVSSLVPWPWLVCKTDWPNGSSKDNMAQQKAKDGRLLLGWARVTNIKTSTPLGWYVGLVPFIYTT
jgi:hypothetical protein